MVKRSIKDRVATNLKRIRHAASSTRAIANPFDQLDNAMLSFMFGFIDASDALRFAKTCQRNYNAYRTCTKRRLLEDFCIVCVTRSWPSVIDLSMRSDSTPIREPVRTYHLLQNVIESLYDDPDLVIVDGDVKVDVRFWKATTNWAFNVTSGEEQDGVMCLLKFFAKYCRLDVLDLFGNTNSQVHNFYGGLGRTATKQLDYLVDRAPSQIRRVNFWSFNSAEEELIEFLERMPVVREVAFKDTPRPFSSKLFESESVRRLRMFNACNISCEITDKNLLALRWEEFWSEKPTKLTKNGIKAFLDQWTEDKRNIVAWTFRFYLGEQTFQELAEFLTGNRTRESKVRVLLTSKSGKELDLKMSLVVKAEDVEDQVNFQVEDREEILYAL